MRALAERQPASPRIQSFYQYAIGKECEDLQRWEEAIEALSTPAPPPGGPRWSSTRTPKSACLTSSPGTSHRDWLQTRRAGGDDPSPIFVLGQPRTGTTLVERIITSHSQVHSAGELQQFGLALRRLSDYRDPRRFSAELFAAARELDPRQVAGLYLQIQRPHARDHAALRRQAAAELPDDSTDSGKALPNAKIVHLVRGPMDACFASFKQLFADAYLHSYDQAEMARHHARYLDLMALWRERFPGRFFDISYEDTARDLEPNARALLDYLELPWEDACLEFHRQDRAVSTASAVQVREPAHTRSIDRWRRYESSLQPMLAALRAAGIDA